MKQRNSDAYQFTVTSLDDYRIQVLRKLVKHKNNYAAVKTRVCVMPRLGNQNPNAHQHYKSKSGTVKVGIATRFDVYEYTK